MAGANVGLWIDSTWALIMFARSLTAHLVESRRTGTTRYYDHVIAALGSPGRLLIIGPGDTKTRLRERMERATRHPGWVIQVEPSVSTSNRDILLELAGRLHVE